MSDIVERLRDFKIDPDMSHPDLVHLLCHAGDEIRRLRGVCKLNASQLDVASAEIKRLRSIAGKADVGQSFSEMTSELRHHAPGGDVVYRAGHAVVYRAGPPWPSEAGVSASDAAIFAAMKAQM